MIMIEKSISDFNNMLACAAPVPGGGGVSALAGALGAGLGVMVGSLTVGKKKYAETEPEMIAITAKAKELQEKLLKLVDGDAEAFEPLSKAYSMPKDAPGRDELMEKCLLQAASAPLEVVRLSSEAISLMARFAEIGSTLAVSDAGCGAAMCKAAMESAALNVFINTKLMKNREAAGRINAEVIGLLNDFLPLADSVYCGVKEKLL